MRDRGFTLIELMIVIAIIAIIAAIAIPNLREAQRNANETAAVTTMRQYLSAQGTYHRTDYDQDGVKEYAQFTDNLYDWGDTPDPATVIRLVDLATAKAIVFGGVARGYNGAEAPRSGYRFQDQTEDSAGVGFEVAVGTSTPPVCDTAGFTNGFGLTGIAETYNRTGLKTFIINDEGTVYENIITDCDWGTDAGASAPIGFPADLEGASWIMVGE